VALDQAFMYNRLGASNPTGMIYALRRDVVVKSGPDQGRSLALLPNSSAQPGNVMLRSDKRPRPLVLRANVGDCLEIDFQNLLATTPVEAEAPEPPDVPDPTDPGGGTVKVDQPQASSRPTSCSPSTRTPTCCPTRASAPAARRSSAPRASGCSARSTSSRTEPAGTAVR
jgi:hypothetical protein